MDIALDTNAISAYFGGDAAVASAIRNASSVLMFPFVVGEHLAKVAARVGKLAIYHNDVAKVSSEGVLTARKSGESVVVALAENGDKELFPVTVR